MRAAGQPCQIEGGKQSLLQININAMKRGAARPLPLYRKTGFQVPSALPTLLSQMPRLAYGFDRKNIAAAPCRRIPSFSAQSSHVYLSIEAHTSLACATNTNRKSGKPYFREAGLRFLRSLRRNNRREWFEAHKQEFERELKQPMLALIETVNGAMEDFAPAHLRPPQKCMMRIYRDIRFSSDKRPYKSHISAWWSRAGLEKTSGGGYYMHISPDEVLIAAGVYMPEREQLLAIRGYLAVHHAEVRRLLNERKLRRTHGVLYGRAAHTAPQRAFLKITRRWICSCAGSGAWRLPSHPRQLCRMISQPK